ncbi:MAG: AfsR/SARP family transcriptional regulator [Aggregatilineales bacterium]
MSRRSRAGTPTQESALGVSSPLVIVLPHNNQRNQVIAPLLTDEHTGYYALTEADTSFGALTGHIVSALKEQGFSIGTADRNANDEAAGRALGAGLNKAGVHSLVLDQFDQLSADNPTEWLNGLLGTLPQGTQVVINARRLDSTHWNPLIANGTAQVIGESEVMGAHVLNGNPGQLEVYALGHGAVWYEGRPVTRWDGPLTRRLFYFLLDRGPVSRRQIFEAFWPNLPVREATNVFHVTKRKMNETVGCDATDYNDRHYQIGDNIRLYYDVAAFQAALKEGETAEDAAAVAAWEHAVKLYRQPFLNGDSTGWIVQRRNELRDLYAGALVSLARAYQDQNAHDLALMHYLRAIRESPLREDLYVHTMNLYAERNDKASAIAQYEALRQRLSAQLGIAPGKESSRLYTKLAR